MGLINAINTLLNTAYDLLMNTVFQIMAIAVIAGAIGNILTEFGVISLANKLLSPLMEPLYGLPGASVISIFTTYLSDNPAVLTLAEDKRFRRYFRKYQLPALTNLGTSFGMGLIVTIYMMGLSNSSGENFILAAIIGNIGAIIGSIVSVRLMLLHTKKAYGTELEAEESNGNEYDIVEYREIKEGNVGERIMDAILEGGTSGVKVGFAIIPGVLIICSIVMILSNGIPETGVYTGAAYEGISFFPWIGEKISFITTPLLGFTSPTAISVPITALGAAGAAIGIAANMVKEGLAHANDVAVFTAMCMCWSGYLSTHVAMMDGLNFRNLTGKAIFSHTIGGICAGMAANWIYKLVMLFM
ncbi:CD0519/CD1768 family membrane protein [Schnuerera ultunensis]|uniref:Transporter gate domain protein n=1 Tax=[Clostridium] ultunense Esp TaxID=1288971 RepID=A0A1M4PPW5_9FIRM|nr:hypothetical protein [Schnuerera ultunensis]SHD77526.1 conserved membrane protein of unknown function [[Clostridium] ultunense Esp]